MSLAVSQEMHKCARCHDEFPRDAFKLSSGRGWVDEDGRRRGSYCLSCERAVWREKRERRVAAGKTATSYYTGDRPRTTGPRELVSAEPFSCWLEAKLAEYGNSLALAHALGIGDRRVRAILYREQKNVSIDVVDFALTREGSTFLFQLYPELYPDVETAPLADLLRAVVTPKADDDQWLLPASGVVA